MKALRILKNIFEGFSFLLFIMSMVCLVAVYKRLPEEFPHFFDEYGNMAGFGPPVYFIIAFAAGALFFGGISIVTRYKKIFGKPLFRFEYMGEIKLELTHVFFSFVKIIALLMSLTFIYNMYAGLKNNAGMPAVDFFYYIYAGLAVLAAAIYFIMLSFLKKEENKPADNKK